MIKLIFFFILIPLTYADSTFFDDENDVFILGNSQVINNEEIISIVQSSDMSCKYEWNCTNWTKCFQNERQTRNCTNIGTCTNSYKSPKIEKNCNYTYLDENITEEKTIEKQSLTINRLWTNNKIIWIIICIIFVFIVIFLKRKRLKREYF